MASNYSYMNNNSGGTTYNQPQQSSGQQALAATRQNSAVMNEYQPSPGAGISQGGGEGITAPPREYATGGAQLTQYGPNNYGSAYQPTAQGGNTLTPYQAPTNYDPYSPAQQQAQGLFNMAPFNGWSNDQAFFQNRDNQTALNTWMSMLPYYQSAVETGQNTRDFNEDLRRYNINTNWTQNMDLQNLGLANQDRQLNWAGLNENARQFNETQPLNWAAQGTNQYGAETQRLATNFNNQNAQFANETGRISALGDLSNQRFANDTQRMLGVGNLQNDQARIANDYSISQEQNRIQQLAAQGVIDNNQATQEFNRLELARRNNWEMGGLAIQQQDVLGGQQIQRQQLSLQDVMNQRQMALEYARLAQQQAQANAQAYGRFATPNVSRTRRNF